MLSKGSFSVSIALPLCVVRNYSRLVRRAGLVICLLIIALIGAAFLLRRTDIPLPLLNQQALSSSSSSRSAASAKPALSPDRQKKLDAAVASRRTLASTAREGVPFNAHLLARGTFINGLYEVKGTAMILEQYNKLVLRLEDLNATNGPDLHLLLAADASGSAAFDVGVLRATKGHANYTLPREFDTKSKPYVLVWSASFNVAFGVAKLSPSGSVPL